jgi:acetyltransferase-like isoleucine patch superfamily enzyme
MKNSIVNNSVIASYTYIGKNCLIQNTTIGKFCSIANDVAIGLGEHPTDKFSTSPLFYRKNNPIKIQLLEKDLGFNEYESIAIGNDVWVGTRALIMNGVKIGTGAIIAANAVVTHDVPPYAVVGGSPARIIKYRFDDSEIANLMNMKWWEMELGDIKERLVRYD